MIIVIATIAVIITAMIVIILIPAGEFFAQKLRIMVFLIDNFEIIVENIFWLIFASIYTHLYTDPFLKISFYFSMFCGKSQEILQNIYEDIRFSSEEGGVYFEFEKVAIMHFY